MLKIYRVLEKFNPAKDYGLDIRPQFGRCLAVMKKGDEINSKTFVKEHRNEFTQRRNTLDANLARFGYKEMGTRLYLDAKPIGIEYIVTSIMVKKDSIRRLKAIPIILAKNNERINYSLLVFLASKHKVILQLHKILKILDELKPSKKVQDIIKEILGTETEDEK